MKYSLSLIAVAIPLGVVLTVTPFVLPMPMKAWGFFHWPMLLVDRHLSSWIPLNAGKRVITLLFINVCVWTFVSGLVLFPARLMSRRQSS